MEQSERDRLVLENQKLVPFIYHKLAKNRITISYKDDILSEGMVGLVKAANSFDPQRAKFSTYAVLCIRNEMLMFLRKLNKQLAHEISINDPMGRDDEGNELTIADVLVDDKSNTKVEYANLLLNEFQAKQKPIDQKILSAMRTDHSQREIGEMVGLAQPTVSKHIKRMKKELRSL